MKKIVLLFIVVIAIFASGCVKNPVEQVPAVEVTFTLGTNDSIAVVENFEQAPTTVSLIKKPRDRTNDGDFPGVQVRPQLFRNVTVNGTEKKQVIYGQWASVPYTGDGEYSMVLTFKDGKYPQEGDQLHISLLIVDDKGKSLGYFINDTIWED